MTDVPWIAYTVSAMEHIIWIPRLAVLERARVWVSMSNIAELEKKLNDAVLSGKAMEAFEELYDDDVVMQENMEPEFRGKDFNRKREQEFFASVEAWHSGKVLGSAVNGDLSFSEWEMDISIKGVGRVQLAQVAVRRWKNGKVVHERFYHK
jgi:hypothetical protein